MPVIDDFGTRHDALVDDNVFDQVSSFNWYARSGYAWRSAKPNWLHQAVLMASGERYVGCGMVIDHVDRNRLNCQLSNLKLVQRAHNNRRAGPWRVKLSRFKGVTRHHKSLKWRATICLENGIQFNAGCWDSELDAAVARDYVARKVYPSGGCYLNFGEDFVVPDRVKDKVDHRLKVGKLGQVASSLNRLKRGSCSSEYKGVSKVGSKYLSQIKINNANINLGKFTREESAKRAYDTISRLRDDRGRIKIESRTIIVLAGAFGAGKTWVCRQLAHLFDYVPFDEFRDSLRSEVILRTTTSKKPIIVDPSICASSWKTLSLLGYRVILCVIVEDVGVVADRIKSRGGVVNVKAISKRCRRMDALARLADARGTSDEMLNMLKHYEFISEIVPGGR